MGVPLTKRLGVSTKYRNYMIIRSCMEISYTWNIGTMEY